MVSLKGMCCDQTLIHCISSGLWCSSAPWKHSAFSHAGKDNAFGPLMLQARSEKTFADSINAREREPRERLPEGKKCWPISLLDLRDEFLDGLIALFGNVVGFVASLDSAS